jgi:hypothetical protein
VFSCSHEHIRGPNAVQKIRKKGELAYPAARSQMLSERIAADIEEWPDNALRHSFASYHLAHLKNAASTALELGHHDKSRNFRALSPIGETERS